MRFSTRSRRLVSSFAGFNERAAASAAGKTTQFLAKYIIEANKKEDGGFSGRRAYTAVMMANAYRDNKDLAVPTAVKNFSASIRELKTAYGMPEGKARDAAIAKAVRDFGARAAAVERYAGLLADSRIDPADMQRLLPLLAQFNPTTPTDVQTLRSQLGALGNDFNEAALRRGLSSRDPTPPGDTSDNTS